jgi:NADH dehydrogenase
MRLVTVFGASGFIGRYVVQRLAHKGIRVRAAMRRPVEAEFLRPYGDVGQIGIVQANIRDDRSVAAAVAGADAVINLVGLLYESGNQTFAAVHADGAGRVARAAKAAGATRFAQLSAIGADADSSAAYARTKAAGEAAVRAAFPEAVIVRPSIVFGPEDGFFNRFGSLARLLPMLPLIGGGENKFQPVYVRDLAAALVAALEHGKAPLYELGGPKVYSFRTLMEYILEVTERKRLLVPLPFEIARFEATFLELLPNPLLTRDQVELLRYDNVATPGVPGLKELEIEPTALEAIVPIYLRRFRRGSAAVGLERHS